MPISISVVLFTLLLRFFFFLRLDTEPPLLKCVPIYSLYLGPGQSIINGNWPRPSIMEDATGTAEVYQVSGPAEGSALAAGQHVVKYVARDASDNVSPMCTILINVEGKLMLEQEIFVPWCALCVIKGRCASITLHNDKYWETVFSDTHLYKEHLDDIF